MTTENPTSSSQKKRAERIKRAQLLRPVIEKSLSESQDQLHWKIADEDRAENKREIKKQAQLEEKKQSVPVIKPPEADQTALSLQEEKAPKTFNFWERFLIHPVGRAKENKKIEIRKPFTLDIQLLYATYRAARSSEEDRTEHFESIKKLLEAGANIHKRSGFGDKEGFAAIHIAALYRQPELIGFLLLNGADPNMAIKIKDPDSDDGYDASEEAIFGDAGDKNNPWYHNYYLDRHMRDNFKDGVIPAHLYANFRYSISPSSALYTDSLRSTEERCRQYQSARYTDLVYRAEERRRQYQIAKKDEFLVATAFLAANYFHNEGNTMAEGNRALLATIFQMLGKNIDNSILEKAESSTYVKGYRRRFFDGVIAEKTDQEATAIIYKGFEESIRDCNSEYFVPTGGKK